MRHVDAVSAAAHVEELAASFDDDGLHFIAADDVRQEAQRSLTLTWGQRVPAAAVTLVLGREGTGKTTLTAEVAADVSRGGLGRKPGLVLFFTSEDSKSVIAGRLQAAEAKMSNVLLFSHAIRANRRDGFRLPRDHDILTAAVEKYRPPLIVIAGSLMSHVEQGRNANLSVDARSIMDGLSDVAEQYGPAVLLVVHPNKARNADPGHSITGSPAVVEVARSALLLAQLEDEDENTLGLAHFKANNSRKERTLVLRRETVRLPSGIETVRFDRIGESEKNAIELLTDAISRTSGLRHISKQERARAIIEAVLADGQPRPVPYVKAVLAAAGITSSSTIDRARASLTVEHTRDDSTPPRHTWRMDPTAVFLRRDADGGEATNPPENPS